MHAAAAAQHSGDQGLLSAVVSECITGDSAAKYVCEKLISKSVDALS